MPNSKLIYILLANIAVLSANLWFLNDNESEEKNELSQQEVPADIQAVESSQNMNHTPQVSEQNTLHRNNIASTDMQYPSQYKGFYVFSDLSEISAAQPTAEQADIDAAKAKQEQQAAKDKEYIALQQSYQAQQSELARLRKNNRRLADKVSTLENQVIIKDTYLDESKLREQELNQQLALEKTKKAKVAKTPIENIKQSIDHKPDLLKRQTNSTSIPVEDKPITDNVLVDSSIQVEAGQDEVVSFSEEGPIEVERFTGAVEFGFSYEQDNQKTTTLEGRLILDYDEVDQYNINSDLEFEYEHEDGVNSTEKYRWQLQADYNLDPKNLIIARSDLQRSQFASYEREDTFSVSYGRIFFNENNHKFNTEIGPGYRFAVPNVGANTGEDSVSVNEFIVRTKFNYERIVSENLQVSTEAVFEIGKENSVYTVGAAAQNRIYQELYIIFKFDYKYNQNVPIDTENDEISTGVSLLYAF